MGSEICLGEVTLVSMQRGVDSCGLLRILKNNFEPVVFLVAVIKRKVNKFFIVIEDWPFQTMLSFFVLYCSYNVSESCNVIYILICRRVTVYCSKTL